MDALKSFLRGLGGIALAAVFAFSLIGVTGVLVSYHQYHFAIANIVSLCFAAKPIYKTFQKLVL